MPIKLSDLTPEQRKQMGLESYHSQEKERNERKNKEDALKKALAESEKRTAKYVKQKKEEERRQAKEEKRYAARQDRLDRAQERSMERAHRKLTHKQEMEDRREHRKAAKAAAKKGAPADPIRAALMGGWAQHNAPAHKRAKSSQAGHGITPDLSYGSYLGGMKGNAYKAGTFADQVAAWNITGMQFVPVWPPASEYHDSLAAVKAMSHPPKKPKKVSMRKRRK